MAPAFEARYFGTCPACEEPIKSGQQVRYTGPYDRLVHDDCAEVAPVERPVVVVCDRCWLVKPCGCEDPS